MGAINKGGMTRREAIKRGLLGAGAMAFIDPFEINAKTVTAPKAKSVIQIWKKMQ